MSSAISSSRQSDPTSDELYPLSIKRGVLAVIVMYLSQILAAIGVSQGFKLVGSSGGSSSGVDIQIIGLVTILIAGSIVLLLFWMDARRTGGVLYTQVGLRPGNTKLRNDVFLVLSVLAATHFLAWIYRSVILPQVGQGGIIGGGSQMFAYISETGSILGMVAFMVLALVVGPIMEEVVFRGYLQTSLSRRMPEWGAVVITSLVFMAGHSPMILWPMYFGFSIAWGWVYIRTKSLKMAILIHVLSNLFYTVVGFSGWEILA